LFLLINNFIRKVLFQGEQRLNISVRHVLGRNQTPPFALGRTEINLPPCALSLSKGERLAAGVLFWRGCQRLNFAVAARTRSREAWNG